MKIYQPTKPSRPPHALRVSLSDPLQLCSPQALLGDTSVQFFALHTYFLFIFKFMTVVELYVNYFSFFFEYICLLTCNFHILKIANQEANIKINQYCNIHPENVIIILKKNVVGYC